MDRHEYGKQGFTEKLRLRFDWNSSGRLLVYSVLIGFVVGLSAVAVYGGLNFLINFVSYGYSAVGITFPTPTDYTVDSGPLAGESFYAAERKEAIFGGLVVPRYWILVLLIPAFGGLLCGFLIWSFAPEASSEGTDCVVRTFHFRNGILRGRIPLVKVLASFLTLGSGGSAGWEGPMTLFGAGLGTSLAKFLNVNVKDRRILLLAGGAAGIGAIFQVPFGGALFAVEILYASTALEFAAILPCIVASVVGYSTFRFCLGPIRVLEIPDTVGIHHCSDFLIFLLFVPIIAVLGLLFVRMIHEMRNRLFRRLNIPEFFKPALGGFLLGAVALSYPQVFGGGYTWMNQLLENQLPFLLILGLIIPKMVATALTVSSGGSGGLLAPSLFIGGLIGASLGHFCEMGFTALGFPGLAPNIPTCTLVGMATFYGGIGKVPFAAAVIVCEMIGGDYTLLIPLLLLNLVHIALQSPSKSLYEEQVLAPIDSEAHFGNYSVDLLRVITVRDVIGETTVDRPLLTIPVDATIPQTTRLIASKPDTLFPVVDAGGRLVGTVQPSDVWSVFRNRKKWDNYTAGSLTQRMNIEVVPEDNLYKALRICTFWQISEIPVVDSTQPDKLLAMLRHHEIIAAYNQRLAVSRWE